MAAVLYLIAAILIAVGSFGPPVRPNLCWLGVAVAVFAYGALGVFQ